VGLAIVKKAVETMHGEVGVEPRPNGGSRFWVDLTRADPSA
jgi:signal transduction histidine kinase